MSAELLHVISSVHTRDPNTTMHAYTYAHRHTHTHTLLLLYFLPQRGIGQDPGSSLGPVSKAYRLSNGWAGQAHARQPWGEWLLGTLAVNMAVRARQVDRTVCRSHWWL